MARQPRISVIIPIYNVRTWLPQCLDSILSQTFTEFELLLIDDGSYDGSEQICDDYERKDIRCIVYHKENEGTSKARNTGIQMARGEYLSFIDADDWVEPCFLEKMINEVDKEGADIVECDVWRYNDKTGEKTRRITSGTVGKIYTKRERMVYGYTAIWKCLFRKRLFIDNGIEFPDCHSEPRAVYPLAVALANKVVNVEEPLYYYRIFRSGSLSEKPRKRNGDELAVGVQAYKHLISGFKRCGLFEAYFDEIKSMVIYKLSDLLAASFYRMDKQDYGRMVYYYRLFIEEQFPQVDNKKYFVVGGYNLSRIAWSMGYLHDPSNRFNFSSIISIMYPCKMDAVHQNPYRQIMIRRDISSEFWDRMQGERPEFLVLDFMEERFDILKFEDGYLTKSDALDDANYDGKQCEVIHRNTEECYVLFKQAIDAFIERIQKYIKLEKIILVKNLLSEKVGTIESQCYYENIAEIRVLNENLNRLYNYVELNYKEIQLVDCTKDPLYFTDIFFEYGSIPSHLNELVNGLVAKKIEEKIANS